MCVVVVTSTAHLPGHTRRQAGAASLSCRLRRPRYDRALSPELSFLQFQRLSQRICLTQSVSTVNIDHLIPRRDGRTRRSSPRGFFRFPPQACLLSIPVPPCRRSSFLPSGSNHMLTAGLPPSSSIRYPDSTQRYPHRFRE